MNGAVLICLIVAFVLALLAAAPIPTRINLLALSLAAFVLAFLLPAIAALG